MYKQAINTFIKGMNRDIDKSVISENSYLDAYNFRIVTSEGASSGAFENIKGNKLISGVYLISSGTVISGHKYIVVKASVTYSTVLYAVGTTFTGTADPTFVGDGKILDLSASDMLPDGQLICGAVRVRDYILLFTTNNTTTTPTHGAGRSMVHKLVLNKTTESVTSITKIYDDNLNAGVGADTLDFSTANKIKALSKYETTDIQKVYWTDGFNNLRYLNVAVNLTITGAAYSANDYMATAMFEFLPVFTPSKPTLTDIVAGNLMGGMVQYSYQLYRLNGAETAFSPVSDMIHIVVDGDFNLNTILYQGDAESMQTGKGCKLSIVNADSGYDRLRLVRLHYSTLNSIPVISIVGEIEISTSPATISIIDIGDTLGTLTLDEFNIYSTELFKCEDIAIKDNRLFAANIETSDFKSDSTVLAWDARAVRFKSVSTATVYDGVTPTVLAANFSDWVANYTPTHDGINKFNDPTHDGDAAYQWMYQANGTTIGAEGLNVKIDFETEAVCIDVSNDNTTFRTSAPTSAIDKSYKSYASPWKDGKLSWQRDEVYRLVVVWGNDRGQVADPKWIIDLKMPSLHDADFTNSSSQTVKPSVLSLVASTINNTYRLYPRIYFKSKPANATWGQVYRVKRERADRSVVTQGFAVPSRLYTGVYYPQETYQVLPNNGEIFKLVSPEINITKNISKQSNDYIEYVTNYSSGTVETDIDFAGSTDAFTFGHIDKMLSNTRVPFAAATVVTIDDAFSVPPAIDITNSVVTIDSKSYSNYMNDENTYSRGCTGLIIAYSPATWSAETVKNVIVNYRANVYGSQYGGNTYEDKALNVSIPCSDIITPADIAANWVDIPYGDTFINYFDVSTLLADLIKEKYQDTWHESVYVPLESSINCDLRHDIEATHFYPIPTSYPGYNPFLVQEYAGEHTIEIHGSDHTFNQTKDLYLYNTVYSQQTSAQYALSEMLDTPNETMFDCLIKASNVKISGELSDSWTKFNINEEIEVNSNYGEIRALLAFNDKLLFWQEDAFGVLSVNVRSLIQDSSSAQLALGSGGILDRYDYLSSAIGILNKFTIVTSDRAIYWFYDKDYSIYRFDNQLENLSKVKAVWSWFKNNYSTSYSVHGVYDRLHDEVLYTLYKTSDQTGYTLAFNEQSDQFIAFYNFIPYMYIDYKDGYLSTKKYLTSTYSLMFMHNSSINPRCRFNSLLPYTDTDTANTFASTIKVMYNADYPVTKVFDNIFYVSNAFAESTDIEQYGTTFDQVRCYDDYQNSGWITLTYPTNVMRRERGWTLAVPRNMVHHNYTTSPDIFTDVSETKTWEERIRDKYMVLDLSFSNTTQTRFVVPFIGVRYRVSYR